MIWSLDGCEQTERCESGGGLVTEVAVVVNDGSATSRFAG